MSRPRKKPGHGFTVKGRQVFKDGVLVATIYGQRWQSKFGVQANFGIALADGRSKKLLGYSYLRDVVKDAWFLVPAIERET